MSSESLMKIVQFAVTATLLLGSVAVAAPAKKPAAPRGAQISRPATTENNASCDISASPAATLLLPFFEVETGKPGNEASTTIFSIVNTVRTPQIARVTVWTDQGHPALWFNIFLTGYDVQSISLYDVIAMGHLPQTSNGTTLGARSASESNPHHIAVEGCATVGGVLPESTRTALQTMLISGVKEESTCRVGSQHDFATGYVTIDVVNSCSAVSPLDAGYYSQTLLFDNVLTGDYERINQNRDNGNYAGGSPLVHIKAVPAGGPAGRTVTAAAGLPYTFYDRYTPPGARRIDRRQPLPSVFAARFIQGGTGKFTTDYVMWREGSSPGASGCVGANTHMATGGIIRFDEDENPTLVARDAPAFLGSATSINTASTLFPPMSGYSVNGWMFLNLDNKAGTTTSASSPYSVRRASQNWVTLHMRAEGRYGVDYDATALANGCTSPQGVTSLISIPREVR